MKYEQKSDIENQWKWLYLIKKHKEGITLTNASTLEEELELISLLESFKNQSDLIEMWISDYLIEAIDNKLKQSIRAKRKRFFDAEDIETRKKSIDLTYHVWKRLSHFAKSESYTLSESIDCLIDRYNSDSKKTVAKKISVKDSAETKIEDKTQRNLKSEIKELAEESIELVSDPIPNNDANDNKQIPEKKDPLINEIKDELAQLLMEIELDDQG